VRMIAEALTDRKMGTAKRKRARSVSAIARNPKGSAQPQ